MTLADGTKLKGSLPTSATIGPDPLALAGTDASGRLLVYAPNPYEDGSSVSHWDTSASPNLLMEPNISADLPIAVDATLPFMRDIGWFLGSTTLPTTWILPSSAHAQGQNNAFYTTDLTVTNTGARRREPHPEVPRPRPGRARRAPRSRASSPPGRPRRTRTS